MESTCPLALGTASIFFSPHLRSNRCSFKSKTQERASLYLHHAEALIRVLVLAAAVSLLVRAPNRRWIGGSPLQGIGARHLGQLRESWEDVDIGNLKSCEAVLSMGQQDRTEKSS